MQSDDQQTTAVTGADVCASREQMIRVAAYLRAEQRGFQGGDPVADWLAAEAEADARRDELFAEVFAAVFGDVSADPARADASPPVDTALLDTAPAAASPVDAADAERARLIAHLRCWIADWERAVATLRGLASGAGGEQSARVEAELLRLQPAHAAAIQAIDELQRVGAATATADATLPRDRFAQPRLRTHVRP